MSTTTATPVKSVLDLSLSDRWLGEMLEIELPRPPEGVAESDLAADLFWLNFKHESCLSAEAPPGREINHALATWLTKTRSWEEARVHTVGHIPASLKGAGALWANLLEEEVIKEALAQQEDAEKLLEEATQAERSARQAEWAAQTAALLGQEQEADTYRAQAAALRAQVQELQVQAREAASAAADTLAQWQSRQTGQAALAAAVRQATEEAAEEAAVFSGWGLGPGELSRMDLESVRRAMDMLKDARLRDIARLAGRLRAIAAAGRQGRVAMGPALCRLGRVQELPDVFPEEIALLARDAPAPLRALKAAEWAIDGLLGLERRGRGQKEGDVVICVDDSGSMAGERQKIARALAVGLALLVLKSLHRRFLLVLFSSSEDPLITCTSEEVRKDIGALFSWAQHVLGGGTSFDVPLQAAMDWVNRRREADIIFISDGECRLMPETAERFARFRAETGARLFYLPVACGYGEMEKLADRVFPVDELQGEAADSVAFELGRWIR